MHPIHKKHFGNTAVKSIKVHSNDSELGNVTSVPVTLAGVGYSAIPTAAFANIGSGSGLSLTTHMTLVATPVIANAGTGGANGAVTITGTTGTGTRFQANGTITNNVLASIGSIFVAGDYTVLPAVLTLEPVTGGSLSNCKVDISNAIGVLSVVVSGTGNSLYPQTTNVTLSGGSPTVAAVIGTTVLDGGVSETGYIISQVGTKKFKVTSNNNSTHAIYKLSPTSVPAPGYITIFAYPLVNGNAVTTPEHVIKISSRHIWTAEGNKYIWTFDLTKTATGYARLETF